MRRVKIVAVFDVMQIDEIADVLTAVADLQEEEHSVSNDDVDAVEHHEEVEGCESEFSEIFEDDESRFAPGVFGREFVAIRVHAFGVGADGGGLGRGG